MKFPEAYVVYDTETTGLDTNTCEVIELAAKKIVPGSSPEIRSWLMKASRPPEEIQIQSKLGLSTIAKLTGITTELLEREGVDPAAAWNEFADFVGNLPLVGHNILRYDNPIMLRHWRKFCMAVPGEDAPGYVLPDVGRCVDTAALYKALAVPMEQLWHEDHYDFAERVLDYRAPVKFNLAHACSRMGVEVGDLQAHRAGGDVEMTHRLFLKLTTLDRAYQVGVDFGKGTKMETAAPDTAAAPVSPRRRPMPTGSEY